MNEILTCRGLAKSYGGPRALDGIDLDIQRGRIVGLLGPNGSGKTTLIKLANGLIVPTQGTILVAGMTPGVETKKIVSYLPDVDYLPDWMTLRSLSAMFRDFYADFDTAKADEMFASLGLSGGDRLKTLSKGNREKTQLVLTMSRRAELYLLDEPIGGVDPAARDYILRTIIGNYNENGTVIISTHLIADVEPVLDEVVFIRQGKIMLQAGADELREREGKSVDALFREVFKC